MAFWTSNDVEPKRNFRFRVQMTTAFGGSVIWWAKSVTTPSFDVTEVEHNFLDNKFYFPGRVSWNEITLSLVDPISVDAVALTNEILEGQGYVVPNGPETINFSTMSKGKGKTALGDITIEILDSDGTLTEQWVLNQPFIKSAKYGDLDYSNDDLRTVELTLRYDWAKCITQGKSGKADTFFDKA